jgi:hypothetical protein
VEAGLRLSALEEGCYPRRTDSFPRLAAGDDSGGAKQADVSVSSNRRNWTAASSLGKALGDSASFRGNPNFGPPPNGLEECWFHPGSQIGVVTGVTGAQDYHCIR